MIPEQDGLARLNEVLERLETLVNGASRVPFTTRFMVDEQEFVGLMDQIRGMIPEDYRTARRVAAERDKILSQARAEAEKMIADAEERAAERLSTDALVQQARARADDHVQEALARAEEVCRGADHYALETLETLEGQLMRLLTTIRRGKDTLRDALFEGSDAEVRQTDSEISFRS
ncbi:MAG: hypothetical protein FJ033_01705 [Chloroflexi bacterium]|nr:hypothetical protein [Chloroflexota bacterium]